MQKKLQTLLTELKVDSASMRRSLDQNVADTQAWGRRTKSIVGGVLATIGVTKFIRSVTEATSVQEAAMRQLQQGLITTNNRVGLSFEELTKHAADLQKVTTFGDEEVIKAQSKLVTFTNILGENFKRTTELAGDLAVRMDMDLSSATVQLGKALNDPIKNLSALSRAGIQFSDDQKAVIKSLVESGDLAKAQTIILNELETQFGGSARAARETFGGALRSLQNAAGDLLEADTGGLTQVKVSIEELTTLLQDPQFIGSVQTVTTAMIKGFTATAKAISSTVNITRFLAEEFAAWTNGPASDDIGRIEGNIVSLREKLEELKASAPDKDSFWYKAYGGESGGFALQIRQTEEQLKEQLKLRDDYYEQSKIREEKLAKLQSGLDSSSGTGGKSGNVVSLKDEIAKVKELQQVKAEQIEAEKSMRLAMADELKQIELEEAERQKRLRNVESLEVSLMDEESRIQESYTRRQEMLNQALEDNLISQERFNKLSEQLDEEKKEKMLNTSREGFGTMLDIADRYYDGLNTKEAARARVAIQIGKTLLDKEKRESLKRIAINTYDAAMGAYKSLSSIPYVGPFLGAGAAAGIVALGATYGAEVAGIAHGGLENVPKESTYLLDKGERVVSPRQNRDLTDFLQNERRSSGVVVNINAAPGVENNVRHEQRADGLHITIDQTIRSIVRDELYAQQAPGGLLDGTYRT
ncbi:hypothetical protein TDB9533_01229 [Thalassocella blandensis]|nr:hypothetical protein TDB9533_01229 [Thalassocella blandensis]